MTTVTDPPSLAVILPPTKTTPRNHFAGGTAGVHGVEIDL